jgi:hypothetical protein
MRFLSLLFLTVMVEAREVRLLRLEGPEDMPAHLYLIGKGVETELDLPKLSPSSRRASLGKDACVLQLAKEKPTPQKPIPADVPSISIPEGEADLLLVLLIGQSSLGVRAIAVTLPDTHTQAGALLYFNLQPRALSIGLGNSSPVTVTLGNSCSVLPPVPVDRPFAVRLDLASVEPGQPPQPFVRATWVRAKNGRHILFVVNDPDRVTPRIIAVPDTEPPPTPPVPPVQPLHGR